MIKNGKNKNKLSYTLLRVVWKLFEVDRKTRCYGTDEQLFEAEIHMIKSIKENEGIHVTGLAELLGVTKGAVSQIIMKLQKKDMIVKDTDPRNLSRLILRLTPKGETAYINHEKLHQEFDNLVNEALEGASMENVAFLKEFLNSLERRMDNFENNNNV
ncbi:MarR family winged helix-turn-helix transcriptional regulator [Anaeromonas gelatinilytica]|uniref:MarR family winged helix-turn-helix transcriptional regulator n=1 Tax=Anaeromonas gelatinilytica TaxID=2683194 RepID=UPI0020788F19|nr:MarR family transcriptional regulator [Anaeromonas gelatinilytica]